MKTRTLILTVAIVFLTAIVPDNAKAQDPFKDLEENYLVTTVQTPSIVGFITAYLSEPEDEHSGALADVWEAAGQRCHLNRGQEKRLRPLRTGLRCRLSR